MVWNRTKPLGTDKLRDSDADLRANFAALHTHAHDGTTPGNYVYKMVAAAGSNVEIHLVTGKKHVFYNAAGTVIATLDGSGNWLVLGSLKEGTPTA